MSEKPRKQKQQATSKQKAAPKQATAKATPKAKAAPKAKTAAKATPKANVRAKTTAPWKSKGAGRAFSPEQKPEEPPIPFGDIPIALGARSRRGAKTGGSERQFTPGTNKIKRVGGQVEGYVHAWVIGGILYEWFVSVATPPLPVPIPPGYQLNAGGVGIDNWWPAEAQDWHADKWAVEFWAHIQSKTNSPVKRAICTVNITTW